VSPDPASGGGRAVRGPRPGTVLQHGRAKAYRPLPPEARRTALDAFLAAYGAGDHFEAHELLEPAWMGTDDPGERDLHQGLIKLAAAAVHAGRGNPLGVRKNLTGARLRLAHGAAIKAGDREGLDVAAIVDAIDGRLAELAAAPQAALRQPAIEVRRH
jgi:hypothetical protein